MDTKNQRKYIAVTIVAGEVCICDVDVSGQEANRWLLIKDSYPQRHCPFSEQTTSTTPVYI